MKKINYKSIAKNVIDLEIAALKKLKVSLSKSFDQAVDAIVKCQSKVILCGVGKSYLIASKISATLSSVGCPSFSLSANECSHGDLGSISKKDVLILFSNSGETQELKPVIEYANRNRITLIGIVSKKNSILFRASDIKLFIPEVKEAGLGIVPTSSTCEQLAIGDCLAVAALNKKGFSKKNFKILHPKGALGAQLKTVEDLMIKGKKIPFIRENVLMKDALKVITRKNLGVLVVINKKSLTKGIITDGDLKRAAKENNNFQNILTKNVMKLKPISVEKDMLAAEALSVMTSKKKITSLCVHNGKNKNKTIGLIHIHNILDANIQ